MSRSVVLPFPLTSSRPGLTCAYRFLAKAQPSRPETNTLRLAALCLLLLTLAASGQVRPQFFTMSSTSAADTPKVPYGTAGHPACLVWTCVEGAGRGIFNWKSTDAFVNAAPQINGVAQIVLTLGFTPAWAVRNQSSCKAGRCTMPPDNLEDWSDFIAALVAHYNGVTAPHVAYYELWCEANNIQLWTGTAAQLAAMSQLAYPLLKSDPYATVLTPSVIWFGGPGGSTGVVWEQAFLASGGMADGLAFHAYTCRTNAKLQQKCAMPESPASTNAPLQRMIPAFAAFGLPLYVTEGSWGALGVVDPDLQQAWVAHYFVIAANYHLSLMSWFTWGKPGKTVSGIMER
jgi:hypothetical protein